jgi:hypothetical protein
VASGQEVIMLVQEHCQVKRCPVNIQLAKASKSTKPQLTMASKSTMIQLWRVSKFTMVCLLMVPRTATIYYPQGLGFRNSRRITILVAAECGAD